MKKYTIQHLDKSYPISIAGKNEFLRYGVNPLKLEVSRLGKINKRRVAKQKTSDQIVIVSCSNLIALKRVHLIIEVLCRIKIPNIKWVHFGDGHLKQELIELSSQRFGKLDFDFKGIVSNAEILDFYSDNYIDLFINLSEYEGIPVTIMEALSSGIPVLATDVGGTSEAVNDKNGFLINKDFDLDMVALLIEKYLLLDIENQEVYRNNAYKTWTDNYDANRNYSIFANNINSL